MKRQRWKYENKNVGNTCQQAKIEIEIRIVEILFSKQKWNYKIRILEILVSKQKWNYENKNIGITCQQAKMEL